MASDRIATIRGTFLRPAISKNRREYTAENIGNAVKRINDKIAEGKVVGMVTRHPDADSDQTMSTFGRVTSAMQMPDGSATFEADIANTALGRDVAALVTPSSPYLKGISIRGQWAGALSTKVGEDGQAVTSAPDIDIHGIDLTLRPGVEGAEISSAQLTESEQDPTLIWESADPFVLITEDENPSERVSELLREAADLLEGGNAPGNGSLPYGTPGQAQYADPGWQADKKKRYPLNSAKRVRAAWSFINQADNASKYTSPQVKNIKSKIKSAAKKFGIDIAQESADFASEIQAVVEAYASMCIDNGPGDVRVSGSDDDPKNLPALAARVAHAAIISMMALDPDQDGDVDLLPEPQEDGATPDDNMESSTCPACGEPIAQDITVCTTCGRPIIQAESTKENMEAIVSTETPAPAAPTEAALSEAQLDLIVGKVAEKIASMLPAPTPAPETTESTVEDAVAKAVKEATEKVEKDALAVKEAADAAATKEAEDLAALEAHDAETKAAAVTEATAAVLEEFRKNGAIMRKGLVEGSNDTEDITDPLVLAAMPREAFNKYAGEVFMQVPAVQRMTVRIAEAGGYPNFIDSI